MINIKSAKRLVKRAILANISSDKKDLAITPLVSGKHGIGKSQMIKSIANDLSGVCITIEGGTLKEGEITGLPYQYKDEKGNIKFRFLPYYAIERIQNEEKRIYELLKGGERNADYLKGDDNSYSLNDISYVEKINLLKNHTVKPVIIFIDEINRTENTVYKELMNILLTRSVNGYEFPWWVFFVGAMNPSTQNSVYATNEMDPAQLDRFIKIKVKDDSKEWIKYAKNANMSQSILDFITDNPKCLSSDSKDLEDEEKPSPSPRGWDMIDTLIKSEPLLRDFFTKEENDPGIVEKDMKELVSAKVGTSVAAMYFASVINQNKIMTAEALFNDDENLTRNSFLVSNLSPAKKLHLSDLVLNYLKENIEYLMLDKVNFAIRKKQLTVFISLLDASAKLLFAQKIVGTTSDSGTSLIDLLFDIFEQDLLAMLDLSDETRKLIEGK